MYTRPMFRRMRHICVEVLASTAASTDYKSNLLNSTTVCNLTGYTTRTLGANFDVTVEATSGAIYILPDLDSEPTSTNAYKLASGNFISLKVKSFLSIKGGSSDVTFQAIVWD